MNDYYENIKLLVGELLDKGYDFCRCTRISCEANTLHCLLRQWERTSLATRMMQLWSLPHGGKMTLIKHYAGSLERDKKKKAKA